MRVQQAQCKAPMPILINEDTFFVRPKEDMEIVHPGIVFDDYEDTVSEIVIIATPYIYGPTNDWHSGDIHIVDTTYGTMGASTCY